MLLLLDLSLEILLTNIHKKYLSKIKNKIGGTFKALSMSKMELFGTVVNCFCREFHLRCLFDRLPNICF